MPSPCSLCGWSESRFIFPVRRFHHDSYCFRQCLSCHNIYLDPPPSVEDLQSAYNETYYGKQSKKFVAVVQWIRRVALRSRINKFASYLPPSANVLDIGCGDGSFLEELIRHGHHGYGTELAGRAAERAANVTDLKLTIEPTSKDTFAPATFDAICLWHVFEHLSNPRDTLACIRTWLKPGGYLLLAFPNSESLQSKIFRGHWFHLDPPRHLLLPPKGCLLTHLQQLGFSLESCSTLSLEQNIFGYQQSLLNVFLPRRDVFYEWLKGNKSCSPLSAILQLAIMLAILPVCLVAAFLEASMGSGGTLQLTFKRTS